jgi:FixJ family two-component response regulator
MFDMRALPTAAAALTDLSERDQAILRDVAGGLSPKEIAERIGIPEDALYRFIAWVLEEIQPAPNGDTMREVYARQVSRPASPSDIEEFERRFGPSLPPDDEG